LVLVVLDAAGKADNLAAKNKLVVFNKCDLANNLLVDGLKISAKTGSGIKELLGEIEQRLGVIDFDMKKTVCFTDRQKKILEQITYADTKRRIEELITELLKGNIVV
jgi:tRNA U34 5-carboxymethylaminomethyl modifying GTPase MnmE/TrmE